MVRSLGRSPAAALLIASVLAGTGCSGSEQPGPTAATPSSALVPLPSAGPNDSAHELGHWDSAEVASDDRTLTLHFTGLCGASKNDYRARTVLRNQRVFITVVGSRPYSNLCAGPQSVVVRLGQPLGRRRVIDGFDGKVKEVMRARS
jgi:hypothetical protein